jgi:hypothetical protein
MKQQAIQYVGLDIHQATVVMSVRDEQGAVVMRATVPTDAEAVVGLIRGLGSRVHVALEEGTQAQWLHDLLKPHAERVVVCNIRGRGEAGNKSDQLDADRLSELLRLGALKPVYHGASALLTLKELVRSYVNLVEDGTRVMLRIKVLFRSSRDQDSGNIGISAISDEAGTRAPPRAWPATSYGVRLGRRTCRASESPGRGTAP